MTADLPDAFSLFTATSVAARHLSSSSACVTVPCHIPLATRTPRLKISWCFFPRTSEALRLTFSAIVIAALIPSFAVALDNVGIYFDSAGTQTCIPAVPYVPVDAYIILRNPSGPNGLSGWELALQWDDSLLVSIKNLNGTNYAQYPEFSVAVGGTVFADPDSTIRLATLSIVPLGSGRLFIRHVARASIPGIRLPCYADGANAEALIPMYPSSGDVNTPVAEVSYACAGTGPRSLDCCHRVVVPAREIVTSTELRVEERRLGAEPQPLTWGSLLQRCGQADIAFIGAVQDAQAVCYRDLRRAGALVAEATVRVRVIEPLYGVRPNEEITVIVANTDMAHCIRYRDAENPDTLRTGETFLFMANDVPGYRHPYCPDGNVLRVRDNHLQSSRAYRQLAGDASLPRVRAFFHDSDACAQAESADGVVAGTLVGMAPNELVAQLAVRRVIGGAREVGCDTLRVSLACCAHCRTPDVRVGQQVVVILNNVDGDWCLMRGQASYFVVADGGLLSHRYRHMPFRLVGTGIAREE